MSLHEEFERWAPPVSPWSAWAKPVLFASFAARSVASGQPLASPPADVTWLNAVTGRAALVVELPGEISVRVGLALAEHGYHPVPLFNATTGPRASIEVVPLVQALVAGAADPALAGLTADSLPAFLLDSRRMSPDRSPRPGDFDNRWMVFPQDFPSATFLRAHAIDSAILVSLNPRPADDLAHVLRRWQDAGIAILHISPPAAQPPTPITVQRPRFYRALWARALVLLGLRRHGAGGFGAVVPQPSSGRGYG